MLVRQTFETLRQTRGRIVRVVRDISPAELLWIPPGFRNNILWNLGHIAVTQQLLHYVIAGQPAHVSDEVIALFKSGTSPGGWARPPELGLVLGLLETLPEQLQLDYEAGRLSDYTAYTTGAGIHLPDIETAIVFNNFHEGIHTGTILCMRRLWSHAHHT